MFLSCRAVACFPQNFWAEMIILNVHIDNNQTGGNNIPKTPILSPQVFVEGSSLVFVGSHGPFTLELRDSSGTVVYTTYVDSTDTQVVLPSTYTGTYELRLCTESYYFYGEITL